MRYPDFLKDNGTIGFVAPSFGAVRSPYNYRFDEAIRVFQSKGYNIIEGPNCRLEQGEGKSNTPVACAEEINDFFINDRSDIIISCGGGELMCEDVPFFDFEGIKNAKPKWYMGYSDNTNLTFLLPTLCDTAAIYAPCVSDFGMNPWHPSINDAFSVLKGEKLTAHNYDGWEINQTRSDFSPLDPYHITEPYCQRLAGNKEKAKGFSGRLLGGCLDVLSCICGTKFDKVKEFNEKYKEDGVIWFIEACDLNVMSIRRELWHLEQAGWFENAKGFIIGRPRLFDDTFGEFDRIQAVTGILEKYNLPIILDTDLGHLPPMMPMIEGALANVSASDTTINIEMILK